MDEKKSFEASINGLSEIVKQLENGDISLEQSIELFEEGIRLAKNCRDMLDNADQKIKSLVKQPNGEMTEVDFEVKNE